MNKIIPAMLTVYNRKADKSYKLSFETIHEFTNDGSLDHLCMVPIYLTLSEAPLSEEALELIQTTPIQAEKEKYSPSQKLRFAAEALRKRLNSNADKEEFYRACVQSFIDQLNKRAL